MEEKIPIKYRIIKYIFKIFFVSLFIYAFYDEIVLSPKRFCKEVKASKYIAVISKKYIDTDNHNIETLVFKKNNEFDSLLLCNDFSGFFNFTKVNDTIMKIENSYEIYITNEDTSFYVNYSCE